jgi:hypothetical protein
MLWTFQDKIVGELPLACTPGDCVSRFPCVFVSSRVLFRVVQSYVSCRVVLSLSLSVTCRLLSRCHELDVKVTACCDERGIWDMAHEVFLVFVCLDLILTLTLTLTPTPTLTLTLA